MIPKIIHYCWFGGNPLPPLAQKCIASWKKYLPDYKIREWNEENFDINSIPYTIEAYSAKKYAFVSDYARFWVLYHCGGVYFDTDVEVIKPMEPILEKGAFMGSETNRGNSINPGLGAACPPGLEIYKEFLDFYKTLNFINPDGSYNQTTIVSYTTDLLIGHGLRNICGIQNVGGIIIYPREYFCPKAADTGKIKLTGNTYTIHHFAASWTSISQRINSFIGYLLPESLTRLLVRISSTIRKR